VSIEAEATHLPTEIEISIEGMQIGTRITAGDLILPAGSSLVTDADALLVHVAEAPSAEALEADIAEAAGELGIVEDKSDAEEAADAEAAGNESGE
jgi:large subunit ribosomal protein L25